MKNRTLYYYYVYIVKCSDKSYYTGVTNNVDHRVWQHNEGIDPKSYTYSRRPVELKYVEVFDDIEDAIAREKQIKKWSRKKKEALIQENIQKLKDLSNEKNNRKKKK